MEKKSPLEILETFTIEGRQGYTVSDIVAAMELYANQFKSATTDEWISVSERLPEDKIDYQVGDIESDNVGQGWYHQEEKKWFTEPFDINVTHWQPLPQPPTK